MSLIVSSLSQALYRLAFVVAGGMAITPPASAEQAFPSRNLTWVVAFPPGGPPDIVARIVGPMMSEALGRPIIVENRPGGSASIAAGSVVRAEPDGHTMLTADLSLVVSPFVVPGVSYDPVRDFKMVAMTARTGVTMVIDPKSPVMTIKDLVIAAKKEPGSIKAAHAGIGSPPHLALVSFLQGTSTSMLLVPYKGSAQAIQDIVAGHVTLLCTGPSTSIELARDGKVRMLGTTGSKRLPELPDVPTFTESGVDMGGMKGGQYFGLAVPAATPDANVAKLNAAVNKALSDPGVQARLAKVAFEAVGGTAEQFSTFFKAQSAYWKTAMESSVPSTK